MHVIWAICWIIGGPFLLIKLWIKDNLLLFSVMLNFKKEGQDILNFDLEPEVRKNVVKTLSKINRLAY